MKGLLILVVLVIVAIAPTKGQTHYNFKVFEYPNMVVSDGDTINSNNEVFFTDTRLLNGELVFVYKIKTYINGDVLSAVNNEVIFPVPVLSNLRDTTIQDRLNNTFSKSDSLVYSEISNLVFQTGLRELIRRQQQGQN